TKLNLASLLAGQDRSIDEARRLIGELAGIDLSGPELRAGLLGLAAQIQQVDGNLVGSVASLQEALDVTRIRFGASHASCAATLNKLAETYVEMGRPDLAEPCFRDALLIATAHRLTGQAAYGINYAQMLGGENRWQEALDTALDAMRSDDAYLASAFAISSD